MSARRGDHLTSEPHGERRSPHLFVLAGVAGVYGDALAVGDTVVVATETVADLGRREADGAFTPMFQKTYRATFTPDRLPACVAAARGVTVSAAGGLGATRPAAVCGGGPSVDSAAPSTLAVENTHVAADVPSTLAAEKIDAAAGVAVENMEGAAFFAVCEALGIPAMEVRTVSNRVGEAVTAQNLDIAARRLAADLKTCLETCISH